MSVNIMTTYTSDRFAEGRCSSFEWCYTGLTILQHIVYYLCNHYRKYIMSQRRVNSATLARHCTDAESPFIIKMWAVLIQSIMAIYIIVLRH